MGKKLSRHYQSLTTHERFELALAALSRQDADEVSRLYSTCPTKTYTMTDAAFSQRVEAVREIVKGFTTLALDLVAGVNGAHAAFLASQLLVLGIEDGFGIGLSAAPNVPGEKDPIWAELDALVEKRTETAKMFLDLLTQRHSQVLGLREGLRRFCSEQDLDDNLVLACYPPIQEHLERLDSLMGEISKQAREIGPDEATAEETAAFLSRLWHTYVP